MRTTSLLTVFLVLTAARAAHALCDGPPPVRCAATHCAFVVRSTEAPRWLQDSERNVPLDALSLGNDTWLARARTDLEAGSTYVVDVTSDTVVADAEVTAFSMAELEAAFTPQGPVGCDDTPPPPFPRVERESFAQVRMEVGRTVLTGAWAEVWALKPGDSVPSDHDGFTVAPQKPTVLTAENNAGWVAVRGGGTKAPTSFDAYLTAEQVKGANRIAMRVVEPTGTKTGVLVTDFSQTRQPYFTCDHAGPTPWAMMGALLLRIRCRRRGAGRKT